MEWNQLKENSVKWKGKERWRLSRIEMWAVRLSQFF